MSIPHSCPESTSGGWTVGHPAWRVSPVPSHEAEGLARVRAGSHLGRPPHAHLSAVRASAQAQAAVLAVLPTSKDIRAVAWPLPTWGVNPGRAHLGLEAASGPPVLSADAVPSSGPAGSCSRPGQGSGWDRTARASPPAWDPECAFAFGVFSPCEEKSKVGTVGI